MNGAVRIVFLLLMIVLMTVIARWLWNEMLVTHITILRPVRTLPETFLLSMAISFFAVRR
jgi:hypothetical protein